jgi:chemotaxis response regulator CheB
MSRHRILIDDDRRVRQPLEELLPAQGSFDVAAEAGTADERIRPGSELWPDVVTMDGETPGRSGVSDARVIVSTLGIPLVRLSGSLSGEDALRAGAVAAVAKTGIALLAATARGERP